MTATEIAADVWATIVIGAPVVWVWVGLKALTAVRELGRLVERLERAVVEREADEAAEADWWKGGEGGD